MNSIGPIDARTGAEILPAFEAVKAAAQALQPRAGAGSYLSLTPLGYSISGRRSGARFPHPWKPALLPGSPAFIGLSRGMVEGYTPVIRVGGSLVPMTGDAKHPQPRLKLQEGEIDSENQESWVCLEVHPDESGKLTEESLIEIVHRDDPLSHDPAVGRQPLAHLLWRNGRPIQAIPIAMFNFRYYRTNPADGEGVPQHFFL